MTWLESGYTRRQVLRRAGLGGMTLLLGAHAAAVARSDTGFTLDAERRAALADLPPLRGPGVTAKGLAGQRVLISFFASWCPPCHLEFDNLVRLHSAYRENDLTIAAVNIFERFFAEGATQRLDRFLADKEPAFHVLDGGETVAHLFGDVDRIPTVYLFGREGQAIYGFVHGRGAAETHASYEAIEAALRGAP